MPLPGLARLRPPAADRDRGSITVHLAVCVVPLLAIVGLVIDAGGRLNAVETADAAAMEAARAGAQAIDADQAITGQAMVVDPETAHAAARAYLHSTGLSGRVTVSDDRRTLTVTVHTSYPTRFLPVVGIGSLPVTGHGQATLLHGVTGPDT